MFSFVKSLAPFGDAHIEDEKALEVEIYTDSVRRSVMDYDVYYTHALQAVDQLRVALQRLYSCNQALANADINDAVLTGFFNSEPMDFEVHLSILNSHLLVCDVSLFRTRRLIVELDDIDAGAAGSFRGQFFSLDQRHLSLAFEALRFEAEALRDCYGVFSGGPAEATIMQSTAPDEDLAYLASYRDNVRAGLDGLTL